MGLARRRWQGAALRSQVHEIYEVKVVAHASIVGTGPVLPVGAFVGPTRRYRQDLMSDAGSELGPQGGDPRARAHPIDIDLSTCICRYGPPPVALHALHTTPADVLRHHPYGAADQLRQAYAAALDVPAAELVVGRGASELLWQLAASPLGPTVAVPLSAYTEYRQAFPTDDAVAGGPAWHHDRAVLADALAAGRTVLLSNPHNPSGRAFEAGELEDLAAVHPAGRLVVDESYVEFCAEPARYSLIGSEAENVAVLRSPSKFFGLAGARVAVAWSRGPELRHALTTRRGSWPISELEVRPVAAALVDIAWQETIRRRLLADAAWLEAQLVGLPLLPLPDAVTQFRLIPMPDPALAAAMADRLAADHGIAVRILGPAHGLPGPALRITAPRLDEQDRVAAALLAVGAAA